jgi:hypothetical protein
MHAVGFPMDDEKQLKKKADQFKMYPSDKVWNDVYSSLHTRRRRFVAGMSVLIGSILVLAGSQLIFPSRPVLVKTPAVRVSAAKPVTGTQMPSFTAGDLVSLSSGNTTDKKPQPGNQVLTNPDITFNTASVSLNGPRHFAENLPEKNITNAHNRAGQPETLAIEDQAGAPGTHASETRENLGSIQYNAEGNLIAAELSTEKSATQLTHLRNDRFSWEIYITPTLNTRYLTGNYQKYCPIPQSSHYAGCV